MEQPESATTTESDSFLNTNNPYRLSAQPSRSPQLRALDSEKQVVLTDETPSINTTLISGPSNAPMVVDEERKDLPEPVLERDADKVAVSSWQSKSRDESAPISMVFHESHSSRGSAGLMNDLKGGAPPSYDSLSPSTRTTSDDGLSQIEPDDSGPVTPRPEDRSAVGQLLSWIPAAPKTQPAQMPRLLQPIIVPQLDVPPQGESVPFARCYSDALASHNISMRDFIAFLDGLAVAQAPNSTLQGLKMFGAGASFVKIPLIPLAGRGIQALASSGSGHSGARAKLYLERAKKEYFASRGVRLSVVKDADLHARLQIPAHANRLAPLTKSTLTSSLCERRLEAVGPYVAPLRYDVPEDERIQGVHKLARKHLKHQLKLDSRRLDQLREDQWKDISYSGFQQQEWESRYRAKMVQLRRSQVALARNANPADDAAVKEALHALQQDQDDLQVLVAERQMALQNLSARGIVMEAELEEDKWSRRLKWIVIENLQ